MQHFSPVAIAAVFIPGYDVPDNRSDLREQKNSIVISAATRLFEQNDPDAIKAYAEWAEEFHITEALRQQGLETSSFLNQPDSPSWHFTRYPLRQKVLEMLRQNLDPYTKANLARAEAIAGEILEQLDSDEMDTTGPDYDEIEDAIYEQLHREIHTIMGMQQAAIYLDPVDIFVFNQVPTIQ